MHIDTENLFHFYSIHDERIYNHINLTKEELSKDVHVFSSQNEYVKGAAAISYVVDLIPSASKFSWLIESDMGKKAIDFFYSTSEKYRQTLLKRCHSCKK